MIWVRLDQRNLARLLPIEVTDDDLDCKRAVVGPNAMDKHGMPYFFRTIPLDALADLDRKRCDADVQFARGAGVAVDLKLAFVLHAKYVVDFPTHGSLQQ